MKKLKKITDTPKASKVKEYVSFLGHQLLDEVASYGLQIIVSEDAIDSGHEMIDQTFGTNYAPDYSEAFKTELAYINERLGLDMAIAALPPATTEAGAVVATGSAVATVAAAKATTMVYRSFNEITGEVNYVGITNDFERLFREHARQKNIQIERIRNMPLLSRSNTRAVEQTLICLHKLEKEEGTLINKINSIAEANLNYSDAIKRGGEILIEDWIR